MFDVCPLLRPLSSQHVVTVVAVSSPEPVAPTPIARPFPRRFPCAPQLCPRWLGSPVSQRVPLQCHVFLAALSRCDSHTLEVTVANDSVILHKSRVV